MTRRLADRRHVSLPPGGLVALLDAMAEAGEGDSASLDAITRALGAAGLGGAILVPALIALSPATVMFGVATVCGLAIAAIAAQIMAGAQRLHLPGFVRRLTVRRSALAWLRDRLTKPFAWISTELRPLVASSLIDALKKQWSDAWGPRMEHLLRYALLALLERPDATLEDILPLFLETDFRRQVVAGVTDDAVRRFWTTEFPKMNYKTTLDGVAPIANKLGAFLAHPVIKTAVCAPASPMRFRRIMDEGQMLIVNLAKGRLGADISNLLGGLVVSMLAYAAYSRQQTPEGERRPFFLYIDEFHAFTTEAFADMLSSLRKYGLGAILAHQHTSQLDRVVLDAVLGNVGTWIAFRVGASDASILAKQLAGDRTEARDLINLPNHEVFVKLMIDGQQGRVFSARTLSKASSRVPGPT